MKMVKEERIVEVVRRLQVYHPNWVVVDHWEADMCAMGFAEAEAPRRLAYVSTWEQPAGRYFLELESADGEDYKVDGTFEGIEFGELEHRISEHLGLEK